MPVTINGTTGITTPALVNGTALAFRNKIINGAMTIDQRNNGAAVTVNDTGIYTLDRWAGVDLTDGVLSFQQITDAPVGFTNSLKVTVTTADTNLGINQWAAVRQQIEGFNVADLGFGTANAKTITASFWVKSSLTGTFGGSFQNGAQDRGYPFSYTILSANTWEYKTVTIDGDTTGTWLTNNGVGLRIHFSLGSNSANAGTAGAWANGALYTVTGATSVVGTNGATFYITGVQLEAGSVATPFENRPIGTELALCQRYCPAYIYSSSASAMETIGFVRGGSIASAGGCQFYFPVTTRVPATGIQVTGTYQVSGTTFTTLLFSNSSTQIGGIQLTGGSGLSSSLVYELQCSVAGSKIIWTGCEL